MSNSPRNSMISNSFGNQNLNSNSNSNSQTQTKLEPISMEERNKYNEIFQSLTPMFGFISCNLFIY